MNLIWKADAWYMAKHQWVADRVYSRNGMSPYQLAAQMFGVVALLEIVVRGVVFSMSEETTVGAMSVVLATFTVIVPGAWYWIAMGRHKLYERTKTTPPESPFDQFFRVMFALPLPFMLPVIPFALVDADMLNLLEIGRLFAWASGFYFFTCKAPTFIERKEHKLAEAMG